MKNCLSKTAERMGHLFFGAILVKSAVRGNMNGRYLGVEPRENRGIISKVGDGENL